METIFALIKDGSIVNVIVADQNFIDAHVSGYDYKIRIDELSPVPGIGWTYDGTNFSPPT